jgi:hypothetical protein
LTAGLPARAGLAATFAASRFTARFTGRALRPAPRVERVRVARIFPLSPADPASASQELRLPSCLPWALSFRIAPRLYNQSSVISFESLVQPCELIT